MAVTMTGSSGIDVAGLISQLTALRQMDVTRIETRRNTVNRQMDAFNRMGTQITNIQNRAAALSSPAGFNQFRATSSNEAVGITTTSSVNPGVFSVQVDQLAQRQKIGTAAPNTNGNTAFIGSQTAALEHSGTFSINGVDVTIQATDTLNDIRMRINNATGTETDADGNTTTTRTGVTASVLRAGNGDYRLILTSDEAGYDGITLEDSSGILGALGFQVNGSGGVSSDNILVEGRDAKFSINGVAMQSTTNTISNAIVGMTFELREVTSNPVNITVARDSEAITQRVQEFVSALNDMRAFESTNSGFTPGEGDNDPTRGVLFGDSTARSVNNALRGIMSQTFDFNGQTVGLAHLGITTNSRTGEFEFDSARFNEMLAQDFDAVVNVFATGATSNNSGVSFNRNTAATQEGTFEMRENNGEVQIRMQGAHAGAEDGWVTGVVSDGIVRFNEGPAEGLSMRVSEGFGQATINFTRGIAGAVEDRMRQMNDPIDGTLARRRQSNESRVRSLDAQIERTQRNVDSYHQRLVRQFMAMEQTMMMLQNQQQTMFAQLPRWN